MTEMDMARKSANKSMPDETYGTEKVQDRTFTITELADEFDLTTRAIRFYEDKGLLTPRRQGQSRIYSPRDRARLILIVRGKNVGLQLAEIKEILDLYDLKDGCSTQTKVAIDKFQSRIQSLERQKSEIDLQIRLLEEGCKRLTDAAAPDIPSKKARTAKAI